MNFFFWEGVIWKEFNLFGSCFLGCARWECISTLSKPNYPLQLRQDLYEYSTQCLRDQEVFQSSWWAQELFPTLCELGVLSPPSPFGWFFLWSQIVLINTLQIPGVLFLCNSPLSGTLSCRSPSSCSSQNLSCFLNSHSLLGSTWVRFPASCLGKSQAASWVITITGLISSSGFMVFHCLVSSVLKTVASWIVSCWLL